MIYFPPWKCMLMISDRTCGLFPGTGIVIRNGGGGMRQKADWRRILIVCVSAALLFAMAALCFAEVLMPESGKKTKKDGGMTVDYSHSDNGYVMVKASKGKKKYKLRVKMGDTTLTYDLNTSGKYEVIPLQFGNGKYTFTLYKNVSGKKYSEEGKVSITAKMPDELKAFLYPNQYVDYDAKTSAVVEANKICADMKDQKKIYKTICDYMKSHFAYDYIKSVSVKAGQLPQIEDAWKKHMGICQDLAAIMVAMLRSQGVPARLMIGTLNASTYHAWVTAVVNGEEMFFDPTAALNAVSNGSYTVERYY